jgi:hypothetical protein
MFSMRRREFILALGGAAVAGPLAARAQQQPKMLRVGFVGIQPREAPLYTTFLKRMAELGYQEGRNLIEQSPRFYMAVNLKTAALLGVSLSDVFVARANEVRE